MQTFKERIDKITEGLALSEDLVDDLLMITGYKLKMGITYQPHYCCKNQYPIDFHKNSISTLKAF